MSTTDSNYWLQQHGLEGFVSADFPLEEYAALLNEEEQSVQFDPTLSEFTAQPLRTSVAVHSEEQPMLVDVKPEPEFAAPATQYVAPAPRATVSSSGASLPMSAFYPMVKAELGARSTCSDFALELLRQPPAEVTKAVYVELHVRLVGSNSRPVSEFKPSASLVYEDGSAVIPVSGHDVLEGLQAQRPDGVCVLKVRINELSKAHRNRLFRVRVFAVGPFGQVAIDTTPMRVLSKTSIILQHKAAVQSGAVSASRTNSSTPLSVSTPTPLPTPTPASSMAGCVSSPGVHKRTRDDDAQVDDTVAFAARVCATCGADSESKRVHLQQGDDKVAAELAALRAVVEQQQRQLDALTQLCRERFDQMAPQSF